MARTQEEEPQTSAATVASLAALFDAPLAASAPKPTPTHVGVAATSVQPSTKDAEETPVNTVPTFIASCPDSIAFEEARDVNSAMLRDSNEVDVTDNTSGTTEAEHFEVAQDHLRNVISEDNCEDNSSITQTTETSSSSSDALEEKASLLSAISAKPPVAPKPQRGRVSSSQPLLSFVVQ